VWSSGKAVSTTYFLDLKSIVRGGRRLYRYFSNVVYSLELLNILPQQPLLPHEWLRKKERQEERSGEEKGEGKDGE